MRLNVKDMFVFEKQPKLVVLESVQAALDLIQPFINEPSFFEQLKQEALDNGFFAFSSYKDYKVYIGLDDVCTDHSQPILAVIAHELGHLVDCTLGYDTSEHAEIHAENRACGYAAVAVQASLFTEIVLSGFKGETE
jgi:hypothetical protein